MYIIHRMLGMLKEYIHTETNAKKIFISGNKILTYILFFKTQQYLYPHSGI